MTQTTDLDTGKTNNLQNSSETWDRTFTPFPSLCLFQRKKVQYETSANRDFTQWGSFAFLQTIPYWSLLRKKKKQNSYVKAEGLRNALFISIRNTRTCFSRRIRLIKSFTTQASSYLFLSSELPYLAFVIKWTWYPYLVRQLELVEWRIISFYEILVTKEYKYYQLHIVNLLLFFIPWAIVWKKIELFYITLLLTEFL